MDEKKLSGMDVPMSIWVIKINSFCAYLSTDR